MNKLRKRQKLNVNDKLYKMNNIFFIEPNLKLQISDNGITKEQIESVIVEDFKGKDSFIEFYRMHNGVYFIDGAEVSTEYFITDDDSYYELEVESIYRIDQIQKIWIAIKERSFEANKFMETHFPFAGNAGGNDFFIEIPTGIIKYISWEYDLGEGLYNVAPDFKSFCLAIKPIE